MWVNGRERGRALVAALDIVGCCKHWHLKVISNEKMSESARKILGETGLIKREVGHLPIAMGAETELVAAEVVREMLDGEESDLSPASAVLVWTGALVARRIGRECWMRALGGSNVLKVEAVAGSRLRVEVTGSILVDQFALQQFQATGVSVLPGRLVHIILNSAAGDYANLRCRTEVLCEHTRRLV